MTCTRVPRFFVPGSDHTIQPISKFPEIQHGVAWAVLAVAENADVRGDVPLDERGNPEKSVVRRRERGHAFRALRPRRPRGLLPRFLPRRRATTNQSARDPRHCQGAAKRLSLQNLLRGISQKVYKFALSRADQLLGRRGREKKVHRALAIKIFAREDISSEFLRGG